MQKKYCMWKDEEVKKLFGFIEECSNLNLPLTIAFEKYANKNKRKPNSVRNYYYAELNELESNPKRVSSLKINLALHQKNKPQFFTEEEIKNQVGEVIKLKNLGYSVRKACLKVAKNNLEQMVRLQNKYRTLLKKQPEILNQIENSLINEGFEIKKQMPKNVVSMPKKKTYLTENEINSLFLGLVKLIKNTAKQEANELLKEETKNANNALRQTLVELTNKEEQLAQLKQNFELLKNQKTALDERIKSLRSENAKFYLQSKKMKNLKEYSNQISTQNNSSVKA